MNLKERIIEKLLRAAKKHKLLTYPALALVAIISVIGYFFSWSTGAGKRVVALIMVMVMLVSQSYFLTSSATELIDTEETLVFQQQLQAEDEDNEPAEEVTEEKASEEKASEEKADTTEEVVASTDDSANSDVIEEETMNDVVESTEVAADSDAAVAGPDNTDWGIDEEDIESKDELDTTSSKNKITIRFILDNNSGSGSIPKYALSKEDYEDGKTDYTYDISSICTNFMATINDPSLGADYNNSGCYVFDGKWYSDSGCTSEFTNMSNAQANFTNEAGNQEIVLYAKRKLTKYLVNIVNNTDEKDTATYAFAGTGVATKTATSALVDIDLSSDTASFSLTGITRHGYELAVPTVSEGSGTVSGADAINFTLSGEAPTKTITLNWSGSKYYIHYATDEDGTGDVIKEAYYGTSSSDQFAPMSGIATEKEGFDYDCWSINMGSETTTVNPGSLININYDIQKRLFDNQSSIKLIPKYKYAGICLANGQDSVDIEFEYKKQKDPVLVQGRFKNSTVSGNSRFTYVSTSNNESSFEQYGVTVSVTASGINVLYGETLLNKITTPSPVAFTFDIIDNKGTAVTSDDTQVGPFTINISVKKKKIIMQPPSDNSNIKSYDGTDDALIVKPGTLAVKDTNGNIVSGVVVNYTGAKYNSASVADADKINLVYGTPKLTVPDGDNAANYDLVYDYISGSIEKRPVYIKTKAIISGRDYVRAGEPNPTFTCELDDVKNSRVGRGLRNSDTIEQLGLTYSTDRPSDFEQVGTYHIDATSGNDSNYDCTDCITQGTFRVVKESPSGLYSIQATSGEDEWKCGANAKIVCNPDSGYDTVKISRDGGATWTDGGDLTEDDSTNSNLKIKLWDSTTARDGAPGAVTSVEALHVSYDMTPPAYAGYKVVEIDKEYNVDTSLTNTMTPGLYFPGQGSVLDFGTYIKSQVTINIHYTDKTSGVSKLYYGLFGEAPIKEALFDQSSGIATISIYQGALSGVDINSKAGIIRFYAKDCAGNQSDELILSPNGNDSYEWSVEEVGPTVGTLSVYYGEDKTGIVSESNRYYNHCEARVNVSDEVSGLERIEWYVNDTLFNTEEIHGTTKTISNMEADGITPKAYTCSLLGTELVAKGINTDSVTVYAKIYDNAGNEKETPNRVSFKIDDIAPEYETSFDENTWTNDTKIDIITWDDLSGLKYARVTGPDGVTQDLDLKKQSGNKYNVAINAATKGSYTLEISDNAENLTTKTWNIQKISTKVPDCPNQYITFAPDEPNGLDGWYKKGDVVPSVTIKNIKSVDEGAGATPTDVTTSYRIWKEGESSFKYNKNDISASKDSEKVSLSDDGVWHINAWAKSISNVYCHTNCEDNDHSDIKTIKIDCTEPKIEFYTEKGSDSSVIVHFTVTDATSGVNPNTIEVMHGNQKLDTTLEAISNGYKGSFVIDEVGDYSIQGADNAGNASDKTAFTPMSMKIKAITNLTDSTATVGANIIKGTFDIKSASIAYKKVSDDDYTEADTADKVTADGKAVSAVLSGLSPATAYAYKITAVSDANEVLEYEGYFRTVSDSQAGISIVGTARYDDGSDGSITVGIFEGGICIMAKEVAAGSEFTFDHIPDGNYNIVATDGTFSKSMRLLIDNGMIVYPVHYIDLVLSGKNTSVVITTSDTPNVTADGMDTIFTDDYVNFTAEDRKLIDNNGTVEFRLYATLMPVTSVSSEEISAMYAVTDSNKVVAAYLDLSLYKIVTDPSGEVTQSKVTNLANPAHVSVTIPLGDIAGKPGLQVVRIHNDGENFLGSVLADEDSNPSTYTISTNQFSTYAVLYSLGDEQQATSEVSNVNNQPTTESGVVPGSGPSTETPIVNTPTNNYDDDDEDVSEIKGKNKKPKESSSASTVGSLTSSGYAKTGDATPVVMIFAIMMLSVAAFIVMRKKIKE
jgi:hypothetical protein